MSAATSLVLRGVSLGGVGRVESGQGEAADVLGDGDVPCGRVCVALADIWSPGEALVRRLAEAVLASGGRPTKGMSEEAVLASGGRPTKGMSEEAVLASGGRPTKGMREGTVGPRVESVVFELQSDAACPGSTMGARQMPLRHRRGVDPLWTVVLP